MWSAKEIITYWFGAEKAAPVPPRNIRARWFQEDKKFDREIRKQFMTTLVMTSEGGFDYWLSKPEGYLAQILIMDQFPRHIFRNMPMAFEFDRQARKLCRQGLEAGVDVSLPPIQRAFFYMPLKHSERIVDQEESLALHQGLLDDCPTGEEKDIVAGFVRVAQSHFEIIKRFNRFPQRNQILKRASREEELLFLDKQAHVFRA